MKIPRDFDRWMFDYKEGNLSQSEIDYFENHILENPQYDADVEAWDNAYIRNHNMAFPAIEGLAKQSLFNQYRGWAASLLVLFISFTSIFYFTKKSIVEYTPRVFKNDLNFTPGFNSMFNLEQNTSTSNDALASNVESAEIEQNHSNLNNQIGALNYANNSNNNNSNQSENNNDSNHTTTDGASNGKPNLLAVEMNKYSVGGNANHTASYLGNPKFVNTKKMNHKSKSNYGSFSYKFKKLYRKIERMTGYPIGLVNLHDPEFVIPNANVLANNFGFAGSFGKPRFESRYRNQWLGESNNLEQVSLNFDSYVKSLKSGIGVLLNKNSFNQGAFSDYSMSLIYSPKFEIARSVYFEPAVKFSLGLMRIDASKIASNTTYEIERGRAIKTSFNDLSNANNFWYKDFGVGFLVNSEKFYAGLNVDNIGKHSEAIYGDNVNAPIKINAIVGSDYQSRNKKMVLSPFVTYTQYGTFKELWGGVNMKYDFITLGGGYSSLNDYSASLGVKFRNFKLIYQYDMTTSLINNDRFASHNFGIRINAKQKQLR
ncbi:MAG: PorP/SprF family type IX secretion system membrane protein [Putridiphycobacter sp.]